MVARQDHDCHSRFGEEASGRIEYRRTQLVILERVPGQQSNIGSQRSGRSQHGVKPRGTAAVVYMNIGAMYQGQLAPHPNPLPA